MDDVVIAAIESCDQYARKARRGLLTEYEVQVYEAMCVTVTTFMRCQDLVLRRQRCELERETLQSEAEHREWLDANDV